MAPDPLTAHDTAVLAVERTSWATPGGKEAGIREELGMTPTRNYQLLNQLLDTEAALVAGPITVNQMLRIRSANKKHARQ